MLLRHSRKFPFILDHRNNGKWVSLFALLLFLLLEKSRPALARRTENSRYPRRQRRPESTCFIILNWRYQFFLHVHYEITIVCLFRISTSAPLHGSWWWILAAAVTLGYEELHCIQRNRHTLLPCVNVCARTCPPFPWNDCSWRTWAPEVMYVVHKTIGCGISSVHCLHLFSPFYYSQICVCSSTILCHTKQTPHTLWNFTNEDSSACKWSWNQLVRTKYYSLSQNHSILLSNEPSKWGAYFPVSKK